MMVSGVCMAGQEIVKLFRPKSQREHEVDTHGAPPKTVECPYCGGTYVLGEKFCPYCGAPGRGTATAEEDTSPGNNSAGNGWM